MAGSKIAHIGKVVKGMFKVGDKVVLKVDGENRMATCRTTVLPIFYRRP